MPTQNSEILFHLPVTKQWLEQYVLVNHQFGLSYRGVQYCLETLFDTDRSVGWIHNIIHNAANTATQLQKSEDLSGIKVSANDELFYGTKPILTAVCTNSLYCPLLQKTADRKADTWEQELNNIMGRGYNPASVILDGLNSLHIGHQQALKGVNIIYDVFHITKDMNDLKRFAHNSLKSATTNLNTILNKLSRAKKTDKIKKLKAQKTVAKRKYNEALFVYQSIATLCSWLQHDILVVAGNSYSIRKELLLFIAQELQNIESKMPHRIAPVRKTLQNKADKLLGFVKTLEDDLTAYANELNCDVYWLWKICYAQRYNINQATYYQYIAEIQRRLKHKFYQAERAVIAIMEEIEKASSVVENLNGRIRKFLINHIHVSQPVLNLFRFIINHREFQRSRCAHRDGLSPSQVLHNQSHNHWLEMLGYKLFKQAA
jgi:hypothetical protein